MSNLVVIIPTRSRSQAVPDLIESFRESCREDTFLMFAVDQDDPELEAYSTAVRESLYFAGVNAEGWRTWSVVEPPVKAGVCIVEDPTNMVGALNKTARYVLANAIDNPKAIAFMGDDHRPRTPGWDTWYLASLNRRPGLVYGNDLHQGKKIPTQVAISASVVLELGHMAPDVLTHLYVDNYWLTLGQSADCLTYLPNVVVEHVHPAAGKAGWDAGYRRVNDPEMYAKDSKAYGEYWATNGARDVDLVRKAIEREISHGS